MDWYMVDLAIGLRCAQSGHGVARCAGVGNHWYYARQYHDPAHALLLAWQAGDRAVAGVEQPLQFVHQSYE